MFNHYYTKNYEFDKNSPYLEILGGHFYYPIQIQNSVGYDSFPS